MYFNCLGKTYMNQRVEEKNKTWKFRGPLLQWSFWGFSGLENHYSLTKRKDESLHFLPSTEERGTIWFFFLIFKTIYTTFEYTNCPIYSVIHKISRIDEGQNKKSLSSKCKLQQNSASCFFTLAL